MAARRNAFRWDHPVVLFLLIVAIVASMSLAAEVLKPLALAILLSFALAPISRFLERLGLPRSPAVFLTVILAMAVLGGIFVLVSRELWALADRMPQYEANIKTKLELVRLHPKPNSPVSKLQHALKDLSGSLERPLVPTAQEDDKVQKVAVVATPNFRERLERALGPLLEPLAMGFLVLILVLFLLMQREDTSDRLIRLFGHNRISLTTKTLDEVARRISRYLVIFATVNSTYGLIVGIGLHLIGVPYATLWGGLAAMLRFIPYVGPATAFGLPFFFSMIATNDPSWTKPLEVLALFAVIEVAANSYLEPVIYGKTTGVSSLALLVAAMFWTWLWGTLGLLLSTPMTVCLAVLGKYVPSLWFFGTLLGEEAALPPEVKYYQRVLALDQDGANEVIEAAFKQRPRVEVFDSILVPVLIRAERDHARDDIDDRERTFLWRVIGDTLDELEGTPEVALETLRVQGTTNGNSPALPGTLVGLPASDEADVLVLRMVSIALQPAGGKLDILDDGATPLHQTDAIAQRNGDVIVISHIPPVGLTPARYLLKRLRTRLSEPAIVVGRWGTSGDPAAVAESLGSAGATSVVFSVAEARDRIVEIVRPKTAEPVSPPASSPALT